MSSVGLRKPPRIMARKANIIIKKPPKGMNNRDDETEKLRNEGFEVHSGVLTMNPSHVTFKPKRLPGVANEIESYPCRFCDKICLTSGGLEKHGREHHLEEINEIMEDIASISAEWKKREFEQSRSKERHTMDRLRHEVKAQEMVRAVMNGTTTTEDMEGNRYESCPICHVLINTVHPVAMESHQRAHKKNDELRLQMIDHYGPTRVQSLTCESCSLVFTDDQKLQSHMETHHVRRKKYICKYCGDISNSISELNLHKSDVHNLALPVRTIMKTTPNLQAEEWRMLPNKIRSRAPFYRYDNDTKRVRKRTAYEMDQVYPQPEMGSISDGDIPCRVTCPECGLKLNRPLLIIKHMFRVHSKATFSCFVESGGMPTFKLDVGDNEIIWNCCNFKFSNRAEFMEHRRMHIPTAQDIVDPEEGTSSDMVAGDEEQFEGEYMPNEDGSIQVLLPPGVEVTGEMFVMFDEYKTGSNKVRLIRGNPDDMIGNQHVMNVHDEDQHILHHEDHDQDHREVISMTQEEYDHMQMQMGGVWEDNMDMILISNDDLNEEDLEHHGGVVEDVVIGDEHDEEDVDHVDNINGTPIFD